MSFSQLVAMVESYAKQYGCTLLESIQDVEFDGPEGSHGLDSVDYQRLLVHFNIEA